MPRASRRLSLALAAAAGIAVSAAGCATLAGQNYYTVEQEWEAGRQIEAEVNRQVRLVNDPALTRYVQNMGQQMARRTRLGDRPWRFYVVADDAINAFNIPGGAVYIHTGLIAQAGSAAELAGAMAHEVAHGAARHGTARLSKAQDANVVARVIVGQDATAAESIATQVVAQGAFARFSRADEREADRIAVPLMAEVGYDPQGLVRLLGRLAAQERGGSVEFLRTHPLSSERARSVDALARSVRRSGLRMNDRGFAAAQRAARRY